MNQAELFPVDPPAPAFESGGYMPPAIENTECEMAILRAMEFYHDHNDMGWEPESSFNCLTIGYMVGCLAEGPFCIAVIPSLRYSVERTMFSLGNLARRGKLLEEVIYFGSRSPAEGNYRGYGYRYSLPGKEAS